MKVPAAHGTVLFFVSIATMCAKSSGTTDCSHEPNLLYNGVHHYFCNIERIHQLTLHWIVKSPIFNIQSTIATCDTEKQGPCMNSDPCYQATMSPDGVSELRVYNYNGDDVECHGSRDSNDLCKFTLSSRSYQEASLLLSSRSMCNLPVSTAVPDVDSTLIQGMLKSTTKVVIDEDVPSSSHTTMSVNQASMTATRIISDLTSVRSIRNKSTTKDNADTASSSILLTNLQSTNGQIISNSTTQKDFQDFVSTTLSPQSSSINYQQNKSTSHNSTKVTDIIATASVINVDQTSVQILKDKSTETVTTTKTTTTMHGDLQSIAIGATAAFVATVCVTGMVLISLYRRSRKSCTHTNILKGRQDKTAKHVGEADGWRGTFRTSTSTCVCLSEIEFPTSLATDNSCLTNKKSTTDFVEMFNPVYSSSSLTSETRSETVRFNP